jgi:hypothetical protein
VRWGNGWWERKTVLAAVDPIADRRDSVDGLGWIVGPSAGGKRPGRKDLAMNDAYVAPNRPADKPAAVARHIEGEEVVALSEIVSSSLTEYAPAKQILSRNQVRSRNVLV